MSQTAFICTTILILMAFAAVWFASGQFAYGLSVTAGLMAIIMPIDSVGSRIARAMEKQRKYP